MSAEDIDDNVGGSGKETVGSATPAPAPISREAVDAIATALREGMRGVTVAPAAPLPATPDPSAAAARIEALRTKINETAATGDYAGAMGLMVEHMRAEGAAHATPVEQNEGYVALTKLARRTAAAENAEAFATYGDEIDAAIRNLNPTQRLDPDAIQRVVRDVRANHMDEIIAAEVAKRTAPRTDGTDDADDGDYLPPMAGRGRGGRRDANTPESVAARLTRDERGIADSLDITYEAYAKQKIEIGGREAKIDLAPFDAKNRVTPGRF